MKSDSEIREDVIRELQWDPQISDPDSIGIAVKDGAVTLTGHVSSYPEKLAAAKAAERVYGVKAVANDLEVRLPGLPRTDDDIARAIAHILEWNVSIPPDRVKARVQNGIVTLEGQVDHDYQRREVERMVRNVRGVVNVVNLVSVRPPVTPARVEEEIEQELKRVAEIDARHIKVEVTDHTARLYGNVHSLNELRAAAQAAASAPGVAQVETHLVVTPLQSPPRGVPSGRQPFTSRRSHLSPSAWPRPARPGRRPGQPGGAVPGPRRRARPGRQGPVRR